MLSITFIFTIAITIALFYFATNKSIKILAFLTFWAILIGILANFNIFKNTESLPPRILLAVIPTIIVTFLLTKNIPITDFNIKFLTAVHIVRLPVELTLFWLFIEKKVPIIMTFKGWNFDILMGISAIFLLIYLLITKNEINRIALKIWNFIGLILLFTIVSIAILSAPFPFQSFGFDQPNIAILQFPYTLLPVIIVPVVLYSHILSIKILNRKAE